MAEVSIIGAGIIPFGKYYNRTLTDLASEAAYNAIKDAEIETTKIQSGIFASSLASKLFGDIAVGQNVFWEVGINRIPIINVENACTSGSTAFYLAYCLILSGQVDFVLVVGAEKMCVQGFGLINSGQTELDTQLGLVAPVGFALRANRHMKEFGTTLEQMAQVAVKNRLHANRNPIAQFRTKITVEQVLSSPMVADPLTRLQCCPIADGAAAVLLCSGSSARQFSRAVNVETAALFTGSYGNPQNLTQWETDYRACSIAYEKAGIGPDDLDVVECHDAFSISEILHYEALNLCSIGEGGRLVNEGHTALGGRIPVNVSGGLLSKGHPLGATGLAQIVELVTQLRQEAGSRQVKDAKVALAHCMGGDKAADAKSCTVGIFSV